MRDSRGVMAFMSFRGSEPACARRLQLRHKPLGEYGALAPEEERSFDGGLGA